ncbi:MAG: heparinase II/III family protein [Rhodospirillales bacterium]
MDLSAFAACPALNRFVFSSRFYRFMLNGKAPDRLRGIPPRPWPGDPEAAKPLLETASVLPGITKPGDDIPWRALPDDSVRTAFWHRFAWLADLHALGTEAARRRAQAFLKAWLADQGDWHASSWRPEILGERLCHWFEFFEFLSAGMADADRAALLDTAARQARHLKRAAGAGTPDARLFLVCKGMIYCGVCLPGFDSLLDDGLARLERAVGKQILPDGGHIGRNPSLMLDLLRHLIDIRATLMAGQVEVPTFLQGGIDRMGPMIRTLRHGDGMFALFQDGVCETNDAINQTLIQAGTKARAMSNAPHTGYQRLAAGRTVILSDTGGPPPAGFDGAAHASPLSFELSVGKERLIVNCGAFTGTDPAWRQALRATAAHSTLTVNDTNALELAPVKRPIRKSLHADAVRREADGNIWLETAHDGYRRRFGLVHKRRLYLDAGGEDVRGDDELSGQAGSKAQEGRFAIRFHLHPDVRASLVQDGTAVLMRLKSGAGWRFRANGGLLALEPSIYLGDGANTRHTRQIVIAGGIDRHGALVKWRLNRLKA